MTATPDFQMCLAAVRRVAERGEEFTTDDVWDEVNHAPLERNVIGKAFSEANRTGLIVGTERFLRSTRPESKGRRVQVWRIARSPSLFEGVL